MPHADSVNIRLGSVELTGDLVKPAGSAGLVVFAHGSGSRRMSPRNRYVADVLHQAGLGTLLFDLLTPSEEGDRRLVFDIGLLGERLLGATMWLRDQWKPADVALGLFGASTGAAAALYAAARTRVSAVVSRGGRPDLAVDAARVTAPTLLIVGERDYDVLELNRAVLTAMTCEKLLVTIPGATHLFEEPGTLEAAADAARDWFVRHLE